MKEQSTYGSNLYAMKEWSTHFGNPRTLRGWYHILRYFSCIEGILTRMEEIPVQWMDSNTFGGSPCATSRLITYRKNMSAMRRCSTIAGNPLALKGLFTNRSTYVCSRYPTRFWEFFCFCYLLIQFETAITFTNASIMTLLRTTTKVTGWAELMMLCSILFWLLLLYMLSVKKYGKDRLPGAGNAP